MVAWRLACRTKRAPVKRHGLEITGQSLVGVTNGTDVAPGQDSIAEARTTRKQGPGESSIRASAKDKERIMSRKRLVATSMPLFITGALFVSTPVWAATDTSHARSETSEKAELSKNFSILHAVAQWGNNLSAMADKKAKSDLVKDYARMITTANANTDERLQAVARNHGIDVVPLDPQTEEGKSMIDRMSAEAALLGSLEGDAWDKEYMTLVTNTQQSVSHLLHATKAVARDQEVKQFLGEVTNTVQGRLKTAQDIMAKIYGDEI